MATAIAYRQRSPLSHPLPGPATLSRGRKPSHGAQKSAHGKSIAPTSSTSNARPKKERPCDACRRRKSRCVTNEGAKLCVLCQFHKQECTFVEPAQPRKRKTDDGVTKEVLVRKKQRSRGSESVASSTSSSQSAASEPAVHSSLPLNPSSDSGVAGSSLLPLAFQGQRRGLLIGPTSLFDPVLVDLLTLDPSQESVIGPRALRKVSGTHHFMMYQQEPQNMGDLQSLRVVEEIVHPYGAALLDIFFRAIHPNFPVIEEDVFRDGVRRKDPNVSPALLAAVYLLALDRRDTEPILEASPRLDTQRLDEIASESLGHRWVRRDLSTVQAGLLALQRPGRDAWNPTNSLVALGQDLGLHLDCTAWTIPPWERRLRKRIAWALYVQDKWGALINGRPSHIHNADWAVTKLTLEDFSETIASPGEAGAIRKGHKSPEGQKMFMHMVSLTRILGEILEKLYTQTAIRDFENADGNATRLILERAKPVQMKLKAWFSGLPTNLRIDSSEGEERISAGGYLHLAYFAAEITLHRRIIQSLNLMTKPSPPEIALSSSSPSPFATISQQDAYLYHVCRSAAKTRLISSMDLINRLRPAHLSCFWLSFSAFNFSLIGTFGALLQATSPGREEAEFYRRRLGEYKWTLSVSAKRLPWLDDALMMLDISTSMLKSQSGKPDVEELRKKILVEEPPPPEPENEGIEEDEDSEDEEADEGLWDEDSPRPTP